MTYTMTLVEFGIVGTVIAVFYAHLIGQIRDLKKDILDERIYTRKVIQLMQQDSHETLNLLKSLEKVWQALSR